LTAFIKIAILNLINSRFNNRFTFNYFIINCEDFCYLYYYSILVFLD